MVFQEFSSIINNKYTINNTEKYDLSFEPVTAAKWNEDSYSYCGFTVKLRRSPIPFFLNTYIPTSLLTMTSFIGFLIPVRREEGRRMALLITILLMQVTISGVERYRGPLVS